LIEAEEWICSRNDQYDSLREKSMNDLVAYTNDGELAVITINNPPVNALSPGVPEGIAAGVERANADDAIKGIVLIGGGRTFIAGADIKEFGKVVAGEKEEGSLLPLLLSLEDSAKPVVAALYGSAFGGGLEIAMACHYRVADKVAQVGQPEVKLGIIPGAAGTQGGRNSGNPAIVYAEAFQRVYPQATQEALS
jgi:3-hydroxyacyl-CoA dehydrogenase